MSDLELFERWVEASSWHFALVGFGIGFAASSPWFYRIVSLLALLLLVAASGIVGVLR